MEDMKADRRQPDWNQARCFPWQKGRSCLYKDELSPKYRARSQTEIRSSEGVFINRGVLVLQNRIQDVTAKIRIKVKKGWESGIEHLQGINSSIQTLLEKSLKGKKKVKFTSSYPGP